MYKYNKTLDYFIQDKDIDLDDNITFIVYHDMMARKGEKYYFDANETNRYLKLELKDGDVLTFDLEQAIEYVEIDEEVLDPLDLIDVRGRKYKVRFLVTKFI